LFAGLGYFFRQRHSLPIGWMILPIVCQQHEKIADNALLTEIESIAASHSAFIIG
jgi:hypothetical protein